MAEVQIDMFPELFERRPRQIMMHVHDGGPEAIEFRCLRCGHETGWLVNDCSRAEERRGLPCPACNERTRP